MEGTNDVYISIMFNSTVEYQQSANLKSANFWNPHLFTNVNSEIQR